MLACRISANATAKRISIACRLVHVELGRDPTLEEQETVERNELCAELHASSLSYVGFNTVEIMPLPLDDDEDDAPPQAA